MMGEMANTRSFSAACMQADHRYNFVYTFFRALWNIFLLFFWLACLSIVVQYAHKLNFSILLHVSSLLVVHIYALMTAIIIIYNLDKYFYIQLD